MSYPALSATARASNRGLHGDWIDRATTLRALIALTKPRLAAMSVLTTAAAYFAVKSSTMFAEAATLLLGTGFSAAGALALNQWRERETDAMMARTAGRPLPQRRLTPHVAFAWSATLAVLGVLVLALRVNPLAAVLAAATIALYAFVYTPLKRRTRWATEIGAVSGALPPLIGCGAAEGFIGPLGWWLFAVLFFWQMPHFFAIGWVCRRDYRAAGFPLLPAVDSDGARTARWSLAYALALLTVSVGPLAWAAVGPLVIVVAALGGGAMLARAWQFYGARDGRHAAARRLFLASLAYLPLVLSALVVERWL